MISAVLIFLASFVGFFALTGWLLDWSNSNPGPSGQAQGAVIALWFIALVVLTILGLVVAGFFALLGEKRKPKDA